MKGYEYVKLYLKNEGIDYEETGNYISFWDGDSHFLAKKEDHPSSLTLMIVCFKTKDLPHSMTEILKLCNDFNVSAPLRKFCVIQEETIVCILQTNDCRLDDYEGVAAVELAKIMLLNGSSSFLNRLKETWK